MGDRLIHGGRSAMSPRNREWFWWERGVSRSSQLRREAPLLAAIVAVVFIAALLTPNAGGFGTHSQLGLAPCLFLLFTGRPCPTCGMTTSFAAMVHFQSGLAFAAHPFGPFVFLAMCAAGMALAWGMLTQRRLRFGRKVVPWILAPACISILVFGVVRMALWWRT